MQILILYFSKGGNTIKLAEAIAKGVQEVEGVRAVLKKTDDVTKEDFVASDGVIAGSPVYFGLMAAAFATSGDPSGGKETTMISIIQALLIYGMVVVGDPISATGHYGTACVGAPDSKSEQNGMKLGRRVAELAKKIKA